MDTQSVVRSIVGAFGQTPDGGYAARDVEAAIADLVDIASCAGCRADGPKLCADYPTLQGLCLRKPYG